MTVYLCAEGEFCFKLSVFELGEQVALAFEFFRQADGLFSSRSEVQLHAEAFTDAFTMYEAKAASERKAVPQWTHVASRFA
jgi:hypothetical protein